MSCLTATSPLKDDPQRPAQRTRPSWRIYLRVIDLLDTTDKLKTVMFAAVNLSSLPGYGPVYLGVTLDSTLSYRQQLTKTAGKLQSQNNFLMKLAGSSWVALRSYVMALCYSVEEYCCPVWQCSTC